MQSSPQLDTYIFHIVSLFIVSYDSANKQQQHKEAIMQRTNQLSQEIRKKWKHNDKVIDRSKHRLSLFHIGMVKGLSNSAPNKHFYVTAERRREGRFMTWHQKQSFIRKKRKISVGFDKFICSDCRLARTERSDTSKSKIDVQAHIFLIEAKQVQKTTDGTAVLVFSRLCGRNSGLLNILQALPATASAAQDYTSRPACGNRTIDAVFSATDK